MKLPTLLVAGSLAVNAALATLYFTRSRPAAPAASSDRSPATTEAGASAAPSASGAKTAATASNGGKGAASGNTWAALNTNDLKALAARLRAAGFPLSVIRAVIGAQVNESFRARREQLVPANADRPFWKTDGSGMGNYDAKYYAALRDIGREQGRLMKEILGADATAADSPISDYQRRRFGALPADKIEQLQRLDQDYNDLRNEANTAARGVMLPEDREKLAILEQEKRADLAQLLSPQEVEDYLMRTSTTTNRLRPALTLLNANETEFRAIYQAQAAYDEKYSFQNVGGAFTPEIARERQAAQTQVNDQIRAALGDERYAEYTRASDREFQQLSRMAQQSSLPPATALQVYNMRESTLKESNRIFDDSSLNNDQKRTSLQALAQTARTQITSTLGAEAGANYIQVAQRWLTGLERGAAVSFNANGGMGTRNVPQARPPNAAPSTTQPVPAGWAPTP